MTLPHTSAFGPRGTSFPSGLGADPERGHRNLGKTARDGGASWCFSTRRNGAVFLAVVRALRQTRQRQRS
jgi:hypothetical protein